MRNTIKNKKQLFESQFSVKTYGEQNGEISVSDKSFYDLYYRVLDRIYDALKECLEMYGEEKMPLSVVGFRDYDFLCIAQDRISFDRDGYYYDIQSIEFVELCDLTDKLYDYCIKNCNVSDINEKQAMYDDLMKKIALVVKKSLNENEYWDEPIKDDEEVDIQSDTEEWLRAVDTELKKADNNQLYYVWLKAIYYGDVDNEQVYEFVNNLMNYISRSRTDLIVDEVFIDSAVEMLTVDYCGELMKHVEEKYIYNYGEL